MLSTIFLENRLSRLLKLILGKSSPGYMVEKRHEFGEMTRSLVRCNNLMLLDTAMLAFKACTLLTLAGQDLPIGGVCWAIDHAITSGAAARRARCWAERLMSQALCGRQH